MLSPHTIPLDNLTERVNGMAQATTTPLDDEPVYEQLFERIARALSRRSTRHVLLVGERGVGQSAVLAELARRIAQKRYPTLNGSEIVKIDCRYVPRDESRAALKGIFADLATQDHRLLCIDGLPALLREQGDIDGRPRLLSALSCSSSRIIGLLTPRECEEYFASDPDTMEFFSIVELQEPEIPVAIKLLRHFADGMEEIYSVRIVDRAVERAVVLSSNYILNERLPYKALRILEAECEEISFDRAQMNADRNTVDQHDIDRRVSLISGVPQSTLRGVADRSDYAENLSAEVVGQEHAVTEIATELGLIKAGLRDPHRPASVMMFVGPTGVGKTEMAKVLARFYSASKRLKTFTLGNFSESHSVSGIIGVPPGYVGHDQGGRIVNELISDPHSVFLLDEADKAHPDVLQPFLNVFDEGWVYDRRGVKAYADRAMFVLTSNVGQRQIIEMSRNGKTIEEITDKMLSTLSQIKHPKLNRPVFTDEFLARIKRVIIFKPLDADAMQGIAWKLSRLMADEWRERRNKTLKLDPTVIDAVAAEAHRRNDEAKGREGGRIVRKLLSDQVEAAIERRIANDADAYQACATVFVDENLNVSFR